MQNTVTAEYVNQRLSEPSAFVEECEKCFDSKIENLAEYCRRKEIRFVFLAGPSSSGKTTFTKKMAEMLGAGTLTLSLDDYYKEYADIPLSKNGKPNYETVSAIQIKRFREDFEKLVKGEEISVPMVDFAEKKVIKENRRATLGKDSAVIIEGLHALNEKFYGVCREKCLKIFICPMSEVTVRGRIISNYDIRFIRRAVRDNFFRSADIALSLDLWESVRAGEKIYMSKYRRNADFLVDTFVPYELCALKSEAEKLFAGAEQTLKIRRLKNIISAFKAIDLKLIPENSILREFLKI